MKITLLLLLGVLISGYLAQSVIDTPEVPAQCSSCIGASALTCGETIVNATDSSSSTYCCEECLPRGYTNCGCNTYNGIDYTCFGCPSGSKCVDNTAPNAILRRYCVSASPLLSVPLVLISVVVMVVLGF